MKLDFKLEFNFPRSSPALGLVVSRWVRQLEQDRISFWWLMVINDASVNGDVEF